MDEQQTVNIQDLQNEILKIRTDYSIDNLSDIEIKKAISEVKQLQIKVKEISSDEEKNRLSSEINSLLDTFGQKQNILWENKRKISESIKENLKKEISKVFEEYETLSNEGDSQTHREVILNVENKLKKLKDNFKENTMMKEDSDDAWYFYQETWDKINQIKKYESLSNRSKFIEEANNIRELLKKEGSTNARNKLKEIQLMRKSYFLIYDDFKEVQKKFDEIYFEINEFAKKKSTEFQEMLSRSVTHGKEFLQRAKPRLEKIQSNIEKNEERLKEDISLEFKTKVENWLKEDTVEFEKLKKKITKVEKEIETNEKRLDKNFAENNAEEKTDTDISQN